MKPTFNELVWMGIIVLSCLPMIVVLWYAAIQIVVKGFVQ